MTSLFSFSFGRRVSARLPAVFALMCASMSSPLLAASEPTMGTWTTTLQGRDLDGNAANGFEAYYDTVLDITWLADANAAVTLGDSVSGLFGWQGARDWVEALDVHGIDDWRLPTTRPVNGSSFVFTTRYDGGSDIGWNITSTQSELAHLYNVTLGNLGAYTAAGVARAPVVQDGPFRNIQPNYYWSSEGVTDASGAWVVSFQGGDQYFVAKGNAFPVWAVRDGDVTVVPEPAAWGLMLTGLALVAARARRSARGG